ncbi:peptidoglycan DD-metalloendopeptidase family protein [uncultured Mucilaginibacter sp.]|uniref:peptidoglycan DD-metalloendopeptidase family protein n=1 Tax=uncultured Mucilaginibacter sp. TaxID=797541 RepID=UPI0025F11DD8|nr:peptidoglycan DD-metalloendopeptidase family protein [uncultured Mucilaginibacter sp.]
MDKHLQLAEYCSKHPHALSSVVDIDFLHDRLYKFNFTSSNKDLSPATIANTGEFSQWIVQTLSRNDCRYGIGGYMEHRTLYSRSPLFDTPNQEPRRLHLGIDIWSPAGTPVYAPLAGTVHSFKDNNSFGDYGATIILEHKLDGLTLYSLYGHLNTQSLDGLERNKWVNQGEQIACFGLAAENGNWPPHLHFQLMFDMQGLEGDYPGVCKLSDKDSYMQNVPDPEIILQLNRATII